jgi:WD40 repeat protein
MRFATLVLIAFLSCAFAAAPPIPWPEAVTKAIEQLGEEDAVIRDKASKKLTSYGMEIVPLLRRVGRNHADIDVRLRANVLASAIEKMNSGEIRTFEGHTGMVFRTILTPDGKKAVSGGDYLRVWDVATGKELRKFAQNVWCWGLDVSPDNKQILASTGSGIILYDLETGGALRSYTGHTGELWLLKFSSDGKQVISGGMDGTIRVWDWATGRNLRSFVNVVDYPRCGAISPDGKLLAAGHFTGNFAKCDGVLRVWDIASGKELCSGKGHKAALTSVVWSADGKKVISSSFDKTVRVWDAKTGKELDSFEVSPIGCDGVAIIPGTTRIITTGWGTDHELRVWDLPTKKPIRRFVGHTGSAICVAVTPDGKQALSGGGDGILRLWALPK